MEERALGEHAGPGRVQPLQATAERQNKHPGGVDQQVNAADPQAGQSVVGRLVMCAKRDLLGEFPRHLAAMLGDVFLVAIAEPEFECGGRHKDGKKQAGEQGVGHALSGIGRGRQAGRKAHEL